MYVCICHGVTDRQVREAANRGATRIADLRRELGLGGTCGKCVPCAREILAETRARVERPLCSTDLLAACA